MENRTGKYLESEYCEGEDQENGDPSSDHDGLGGVDQPNLHKHHNQSNNRYLHWSLIVWEADL